MTVDIEEALRRIDALLAPVDAALARDYPGDRGGNQPIHSVYVPADRVSPDTVAQWQSQARALLEEHSAFVATLGGGVDVDALDRILATAPIQDLRADFEDGYTHLGDAAEDADARRVGAVLAGLGGSPPRFGIRARGLEPAERRRGLQTLALVLDGAGGVPDGFVFTVPKVRSADQGTDPPSGFRSALEHLRALRPRRWIRTIRSSIRPSFLDTRPNAAKYFTTPCSRAPASRSRGIPRLELGSNQRRRLGAFLGQASLQPCCLF